MAVELGAKVVSRFLGALRSEGPGEGTDKVARDPLATDETIAKGATRCEDES